MEFRTIDQQMLEASLDTTDRALELLKASSDTTDRALEIWRRLEPSWEGDIEAAMRSAVAELRITRGRKAHEYMTTNQAAKRYGVGAPRIRRAIKAGELIAAHFDGGWFRIKPADFEAWFERTLYRPRS